MTAWSKVRGFVRRHKKQEEVAAEAIGINVGWRVLSHLLAAGVAAAAVAVPTMIDVSNNNGTQAVQAIAAPGVRAVEAKATESTTFRDRDYPVFRAAAWRAHKPFGGYMFLHPNGVASGRAQADYFLAYASPRRGDLEPVVDDEVGSPCASGPTALAALNELRAHGFHPILYTSAYWLSQLERCEPGLKTFPVWEAEYGPRLDRYPGFRVVAWQYTDNSGVRGMRIDGSHLYATLASLEIGGSTPRPKPPAPPTPAQKKKAAQDARKRRLRHLAGYFAWYEWERGVSRWRGFKPRRRDIRPRVPHRISRRWWARDERQWKAAHDG